MNPSEGLHKGVFSRRQNKYKEASLVTKGLVIQGVSGALWIFKAGYSTSHPLGLCQAVGVCLYVHMYMYVFKHTLIEGYNCVFSP